MPCNRCGFDHCLHMIPPPKPIFIDIDAALARDKTIKAIVDLILAEELARVLSGPTQLDLPLGE